MHNFIPNTSKLDEKIVAKRDPMTLSIDSPPENRDILDPESVTMEPVKSPSRWKQLLLAIGVGLSVSSFDYRESNSPDEDPFGRSIDRPQLQALSASAGLNVNSAKLAARPSTTDRNTDRKNASTAAARLTTAQAAVTEAKAAIALSRVHVEQADLNLQTFKSKYFRDRNLSKNSAAAPPEHRKKLERARVAYNFATTQKSHALHGLKQAQAQLAVAEAGVDKVRSQLAKAIPKRKCDRAKNLEI
jgi:hypothetical protein